MQRNFPPVRRKSLRIQADVAHTFGPLLIPLAVILLTGGGFLLESTITNPLASDPGAILFGSAILTCGLLLVSFLLRSLRNSPSLAARRETTPAAEQPAVNRDSPNANVLPQATPPASSPRHYYVDETRVSR